MMKTLQGRMWLAISRYFSYLLYLALEASTTPTHIYTKHDTDTSTLLQQHQQPSLILLSGVGYMDQITP